MNSEIKYTGSLVEYLDRGGLHTGFVVREQGDKLVIRDHAGHERVVVRELIMMRHGAARAEGAAGDPAARIAALEEEKIALRGELDLTLLWEVTQEQGRAFSAEDLAELFFGRRSSAGGAVMLEALIADRIYFVRRNREFMVRSPEQVERLRVQESRVRMRSEEGRRTRDLLTAIIANDTRTNGAPASSEGAAPLIAELQRYLKNPSTRSQELTVMLGQAAPEVDPAEVAFEVLERLGAAPATPRFAAIGALPTEFSEAAQVEAVTAAPMERAAIDGPVAFTIDDEETLEVDDALSCEVTADGQLRVGIHIALVADFVAQGGAMDREAAARATTVYLPETTVRMLPDEICCRRASLIAGQRRPVLSTSVLLGPHGELLDSAISPRNLGIGRRLSYSQADRILGGGAEDAGDEVAAALRRLYEAALELRERRKRAGASLMQRREAKVRVRGDEIEIEIIDNSNSPSRLLVAEFMVLNNFVAASYAAERRIPIIYRVQPAAGDAGAVRARLSVYPEYHAGAGLRCYAQLSSPIRRYADLVLQRQLVSELTDSSPPPYDADGILAVLANTENAEAEAKELERRARRYWILRYLQRHAVGGELAATVTRDGVSAELDDYAVRGALRGAPNVSSQTQIRVRIARVDPLRGWLSFDYLATVPRTIDRPS
ncbi:MAG TPA: ribonuclease catalytic domain-containing protein [Candidatus Binataceae bacterium]|nr:ribonuclease catalytic domain-containing protein [Candidatus Binataceae bacterium]